GQTMVVFGGPVEFLMGSPRGEPNRQTNELLHHRRVPRSYALATTEVTVEQYQRFLRATLGTAPANLNRYSPDPDCPMVVVSWLDAVRYCRWLSEKEGVPEDQMCYPPLPEIKEGMTLPADYL